VFPILVHNRCSDFELVSPVYFGHNVIWHIPPDQKVGVNAVTRAIFGRDINKYTFESVLIYKLQRKKQFESNGQPNTDSTFTEDTSTSLQLLVIWRSDVRYENGCSMHALLIKHSNAITWNEDTLEKLHSMYLDPLRDNYNIKDRWLLDDTTVLMITSKWKENNCLFKITISEGARKDDSMEPLWISSNICNVTDDSV
jgi:hypothetical protein